MAMLIVFILLVLSLSSYTARQIIYDASIRQQEQLGKLYEREFIKINNSLQEHAQLIASDPQLKQYTYAVTSIGADKFALRNLYTKKFKPSIKQGIILLNNNTETLFSSNEQENLYNLEKMIPQNNNDLFYINKKDHLLIAIKTPVLYQDEKIAKLVLYQVINNSWLNTLPRDPDTHLFITANNQTIITTYSGGNKQLSLSKQQITLDDEQYNLTVIPILKDIKNSPHLWLAKSKTQLFAPLREFSKISFMLILSSSLLLLIIGILAIKRITATINDLVIASNLMTQGKKPNIKRSESNTEISILYNQFADMVDSIDERDKKVQAAHEQLKKISITDEMTLLYNRRYLNDIYPKLIAQAERSQLSVCAILCDIDFFKKINDTHGHTAGDQCLIYFSNLLRSITRSNDYLFRMGGEEFLVLSLTKDITNAVQLGEKICRATAENAIEWEDAHIPMTVSCGVSCSIQHEEDSLSSLISSADHALYQAKRNGRNQVCTAKT